jgi:hypothetical protein
MSANTHSRNVSIKSGIGVGSVLGYEVEAGSLPFWKPSMRLAVTPAIKECAALIDNKDRT